METVDYPYKDGSTFFNTGFIDYLDENFVASENQAGRGFKNKVKDQLKENAKRFSDKNVVS